ncbi:hypothetical protein ABT095_23610 [Kitasatospora sp. NPDC002227]|uniref:hypothetical protein n=1 Tax=Kitasatospora sp. NPDC002227 TaxID=3154773 RepID=UPI00331A430F
MTMRRITLDAGPGGSAGRLDRPVGQVSLPPDAGPDGGGPLVAVNRGSDPNVFLVAAAEGSCSGTGAG